jgi:hypothetical protein
MERFNSTCIPWIDTRACKPSMQRQFTILCYVSLSVTLISALIFVVAAMRRYVLDSKRTTLFLVMVPHVIVWAIFQSFYLIVKGFSPSNYDVPPQLLTFTNLVSSSLLSNPIPLLIATWASLLSKSFKKKTYRTPYIIIVVIFNVLSSIFSVLAGFSPKYYYIWMRVTLGLWVIYLLGCCVLLFHTGIRIYIMIGKSESMATKGKPSPELRRIKSSSDISQSPSDTSSDTLRARRSIVFILRNLVVLIFVPVVGTFIFYISYMNGIESSTWLPLVIWYACKIGSASVVVIWAVYLWRNTKSGHDPPTSRDHTDSPNPQ